MIHPFDGQTERQTDGRTDDSIGLARAKHGAIMLSRDKKNCVKSVLSLNFYCIVFVAHFHFDCRKNIAALTTTPNRPIVYH